MAGSRLGERRGIKLGLVNLGQVLVKLIRNYILNFQVNLMFLVSLL